MKVIVTVILMLFFAMGCYAQEMFFAGYILDEDSIPVEQAVVINYRSLRAYATDENGFFKIRVQAGDSIKINHISYGQQIIHVNDKPAEENKFYLNFEPYEIQTVGVKFKDYELENFHRNMALMFEQLKLNPPGYVPNRGAVYNPYDPSAHAQYFAVDFIELYKLIKKKKLLG